jgi:hypothetical protein
VAFVQFFGSGILHRLSLVDINQYSAYEAIPFSFSWSSLSGKVDDDTYAAAIEALLHLIRQFQRFDYNLIFIFWHMASVDEVTMSALDRILHESEDSDPSFIYRILRESPNGIASSNPMFVMHVLMECALEIGGMSLLVRSHLSTSGYFRIDH